MVNGALSRIFSTGLLFGYLGLTGGALLASLKTTLDLESRISGSPVVKNCERNFLPTVNSFYLNGSLNILVSDFNGISSLEVFNEGVSIYKNSLDEKAASEFTISYIKINTEPINYFDIEITDVCGNFFYRNRVEVDAVVPSVVQEV